MKKLTAICFVVLLFSTIGYAEFAILKIEERVKNSNLIVVGKLTNVSESETENLRISKGTLVVEKVIYGNFVDSKGQRLKAESRFDIEWRNSKMIACQFGFAENEAEIWFLTVDDMGRIESLSPGSSASLADLPEVKKHLKKLKRANEVAKTIEIQNNSEQMSLNQIEVKNEPQVSFGIYSLERKPNYSLISVFCVIFVSVGLYYLLYRSRFKIR